MEFFMTYGWAILIVAVVLAALFELGIFNHGFAASTCIPIPGFVCKNPIYTSNAIGFTFGQNTGRYTYGNWVFIASQGEPLNVQGIPVNFTNPANGLPVGIGPNSQLIPGQTVFVDFTNFAAGAIPPGIPTGTNFAGYVWLGYCTSTPCAAPTNYEKVATMTLVSVSGVILQSVGPLGSPSNPFPFGGGWQGSGYYNNVPGHLPGAVIQIMSQSAYDTYITTTTTTTTTTITTTTSTTVTTTTSTTSTSSTTVTSTTTTTSTTSTTTTTTTVPVTYNPTGGYSGSDNVEFSSSGTLSGDITTTGDITIDSGVTITTNGYGFIAGGTFNNMGTINTGSQPNTGGDGCCGVDGGNNAYGLYIQANSVTVGTVNAQGQPGGNCGAVACGGGGGGGSVLVEYGSSYTPGSCNLSGGSGGHNTGSGGCFCAAASGANGGNTEIQGGNGGSGSPGSTPPEPSQSQVLSAISAWGGSGTGIQSYLESGGGGGGSGCYTGGLGPGTSFGSSYAGSGGGGGTFNGCGYGTNGGNGGAGQVIAYQYSTPPINP